jgi:CelD/BcsL family acetyltransferase involved in cellulose biosynthesis
MEDFDILVEMSLHQFGDRSFMAHHRFREGFRDAMKYLHQKKLLQMVTIEIDGKIAAVDLGALYKGIYTVFIGGTNPEFPGIAKYINMYHITNSFNRRFRKVDFLCGDFHWKKLWHLDPEPLYKYVSQSIISDETEIENKMSISRSLSYHTTISLNP